MGALRAGGSIGSAASLLVSLLAVWAAGCGVRSAEREAAPALAEYAGREIERVRFAGSAPFSADTLADLIETEPTHCSLLGLPFCIPFTGLGERERRVNVATVQRDAARLALFYRQSGYFGTGVIPVVEPAEGDAVTVTFVIERGDAVYLDSLAVGGTQGIVDAAALERRLPLRSGDLFDLGEFAASADTIRRALLDRGYAYAEVLRNYTVDTATDRAVAELVAAPGPRVVVDSIVIRGLDVLDRSAVLRQLALGQGDLLRPERLIESQRNLYTLDLVQFATVEIAPDSLQLTPADSARSTVVVTIAEAPEHVVEAAVGFGTVECFRTETRWVDRSFLGGGARRLTLVGSVSKIGLGPPLDFGFGGSVCRAFREDPFAGALDYRFSADLLQPGFVSPRNQLTLAAFAERQSEPRVYQREARGGRIMLARRLAVREVLTTSLEVERGRALAIPVVFCTAFQVCQPSDIAALSQRRWKNLLGASWFRDRTNRLVDPTGGHQLRTAVAWAAPWLGSEVDFVRGTAEGSLYRSVRPEWVLALHLRTGTFFGTAGLGPGRDFLPPEERFYAGGATSVRGFRRNELGPGVYVGEGPVFDSASVRFVPVGGTSVVVANVELRMPAPFARDYLRLATFVDVGALDSEPLWETDSGDWRITPGVGLRLQTPIGPVRADVAYNPYPPRPGPLFLSDPTTGTLIRVADRFAPERGGFLNRLRFHLAVGQPF